MITKGKLYTILFLMAFCCVGVILFMKQHYQQNNIPALMANTIWHEQSVMHSYDIIYKFNKNLRKKLLEVADNATQEQILEIKRRTKSIQESIFRVSEKLVEITGGQDINTGIPIGIANRKICTSYLVDQGQAEKIKQQVDEYLNFINNGQEKSPYFSVGLMPSPTELHNNEAYHGDLLDEWIVGDSYGEFLLQDLSLAQCLLHFSMINKQIASLEMMKLQEIEKKLLEKEHMN